VSVADNLPPLSADVTDSGSLNLSEHPGPHRRVTAMLYLLFRLSFFHCAGPSGRAVYGVVYGRSPTAIVGSNPNGGMVVCLLCVLSGRGLCDELITRPEESFRLWRVVVCDQQTSW
jgi:hypothetical protein